MAVYHSNMMKFYVRFNGNVRMLILFLKYIFEKYEIRGTNMLTTSVILWLVVFLMQKNGTLPSIEKVNATVKVKTFICNGLSWGIPKDCKDFALRNPGDTSQAFLWFKTFLKFYREFEFSKFVIDPYSGKEFSVKEASSGFVKSAMNIRAPFDKTGNIGKSVLPEVVERFQLVCEVLYSALLSEDFTINTGRKRTMFRIFPNEILEPGPDGDKVTKKYGKWEHPSKFANFFP